MGPILDFLDARPGLLASLACLVVVFPCGVPVVLGVHALVARWLGRGATWRLVAAETAAPGASLGCVIVGALVLGVVPAGLVHDLAWAFTFVHGGLGLLLSFPYVLASPDPGRSIRTPGRMILELLGVMRPWAVPPRDPDPAPPAPPANTPPARLWSRGEQ